MFKKGVLLLFVLMLWACKSSKPVASTTQETAPRVAQTTKKPTATRQKTKSRQLSAAHNETEIIESTSKTVVSGDLITNYIEQYKDIAMGNMQKYGIPASIILAQGILESGAGRGDLAISANNHFGIKCHNDWSGERVRHDDDARQECFRKYDEVSESYQDHALFLVGKNRYATLFTYKKDDYKAWARGLRRAGYATDPRYPEKLISYIERYDLYNYDNQVMGKKHKSYEKSNRVRTTSNQNHNSNDSFLYEVRKGDTLYSISKKFNLVVEDLKRKNNLRDNTLSVGQKLKVK